MKFVMLVTFKARRRSISISNNRRGIKFSVGLLHGRLTKERLGGEYRVYYQKVPTEEGGHTVDHSAVIYR
jgi:hypothetical protein